MCPVTARGRLQTRTRTHVPRVHSRAEGDPEVSVPYQGQAAPQPLAVSGASHPMQNVPRHGFFKVHNHFNKTRSNFTPQRRSHGGRQPRATTGRRGPAAMGRVFLWGPSSLPGHPLGARRSPATMTAESGCHPCPWCGVMALLTQEALALSAGMPVGWGREGPQAGRRQPALTWVTWRGPRAQGVSNIVC